MNSIPDSVYRSSVAKICSASALMSAVSVNAGPLKPAGLAGGVLKMKPTAPESSTSGAMNSQNAMPPAPWPESNGKVA
jgi:hypothetical protein